MLRLQAEKKVFSRQGVADISTADAAARLVCLSEEGQVRNTPWRGVCMCAWTAHDAAAAAVIVYSLKRNAGTSSGTLAHGPAILG